MLDYTSDPDYEKIPDLTRGSINRYVEKGIAPGDFMTGMLTNNLGKVCWHADTANQKAICAIYKFLYNQVPGGCWGDRLKFQEWCAKGGFEGHPSSNLQESQPDEQG